MGGSSTTTVTQAPPSAEETAYLNSQQALAAKQLELLTQQQSFNNDYLTQVKPLLEQTIAAQTAALAQANDPVQQEIAKKQAALQLQSLQDAADLAPLQKAVLQKQLEDIQNGPGATAEQAAQIDAATQGQLDKGKSDINEFSTTALDNLRTQLAPGLGLRPTDTPIVDRGQLVAKEAVRQEGQLTSSLATANASAKLNYPLAAAGVSQAGADFAGNLKQASDQFQAALQDAAATNRLRLLSSGSDIVNSGTNQGIGLVTGSRENPLSFSRGSTQETSQSLGLGQILGGIGQGLGAIGMFASDARVKYNVETDYYDRKGRRWVNFTYKGEPPSVRHHGVIAQEVERTDPDAVFTNGIGLKVVNYAKLREAA